ncbi:MAG TPA: ferritin-like domain-containing protein [Dehalococcoidia bacterium]|nr:ferritin-like domain-containing protein [Dehalococcoidia bacterium]
MTSEQNAPVDAAMGPRDRITLTSGERFAWMTSEHTEWGIRARPGERGLRLADINIGSYGEVPDVWPYDTEIPRGALPNETAEGMGYSIFEKQEVWAESCAELYEDAIQARWAPATDIPWASLSPLPREIEAAVCQLSTDLSQRAYAAGACISGWLQHISYGYLEVKSYLATQIFEHSRHAEAFRKRALANGGGLGIEPPNTFTQRYMEAMNFSEALLCIDVLEAAFQVALFEAGDELAQNEAERELYRRCLGDKLRHLQYGREHLAWVVEHAPQRAKELQRYLAKAEHAMVADIEQPISSEPLIVLFGGGLEGIDRGAARLHALRRAQVERYLQTLREAGFDHADFPLHSHLAAFTEQPVEA